MGYFRNILQPIDMFGNALAAGNPENTISSRTGYFAREAKAYARWYWLTLEFVIDLAFFPFDGWGHCAAASSKENDEIYGFNRKIALVLFGLITIIGCLVIMAVSYPYYWIKLLIKAKKKN